MRVSIKTEGFKQALKMYDHKLVHASAKSAMNKLKNKVKTAASKKIRKKFRISATDLNRKIETKLYSGGLTAEVSIRSRSIGLLNFGATATRGKTKTSRAKGGGLQRTTLKRRGRNQGVAYSVVRGSRKTLPNAFIARGQRGRSGRLSELNAQVFVRRSGGGISPVRVLSPSSMFMQEPVQRRIARVVQTQWPKLFNHELKRRLDRIK